MNRSQITEDILILGEVQKEDLFISKISCKNACGGILSLRIVYVWEY